MDPSAAVGPFAVVERRAPHRSGAAGVGALCFVGEGARLGEEVRLYPRVVVRDGVSRSGTASSSTPGAVLGARRLRLCVSTGAPTARSPGGRGCASRTMWRSAPTPRWTAPRCGVTVIGRGSKVDNLVQVAHNCEIGEDVILVSRSGGVRIDAGSGAARCSPVRSESPTTRPSERGAIVAAKSGLTGDIPAGEVWSGIPARPTGETKRIWAAGRPAARTAAAGSGASRRARRAGEASRQS